jgi:phage/plasmid-like protein (TIGR03299 family)
MAHEISITADGLAEAMFANQPAWHGLGKVLSFAPNSEVAIKEAHLDWVVGKKEIQLVENSKMLDGWVATVREDTGEPLGVVGDGYEVVQNAEAFSFLDSLLQDGIMKYESAFALKGGTKVCMLARMPSVDEVAEGDKQLRYVLLQTSHDGTSALNFMPTSVRVVCANTLRMALADKQHLFSIRHTAQLRDKLDKARLYISQFDKQYTLFRDKAQVLATRKYSRDEAKAYIDTLFPEVEDAEDRKRAATIRERKVGEVRNALQLERNSLPSIKGSWWALFNAVTDATDHKEKGYKGKDDRTRAENRFINLTDGVGAAFKDKAFAVAREMAGV